MKAAVLTDIRKMEIRDVPAPTIANDDDVLLKLERVGVCGSDVHYYTTGRIGSQVVQFPFIVGHESAATVVEIGPGVTGLKPGDTVAVDPAVVCHACDQCRQGRENTCRKLIFLGCPGQIAGCLCEYIVMPEPSLYKLDRGITLDQATLSEPLAIGVYGAQQALLTPESNIAILGAGPIGLSVLLAARHQGMHAAYLTDKLDNRVDTARAAGATWAGSPDKEDVVAAILDQQPTGMHVVFECAGQQETIDQCVELVQPGGKIMLIGIPQVDRISFTIDKMRRKEITVINVRRQKHCVQPTLDMIAAGVVDVDFMLTHRFTLDQTPRAFDLVDNYEDGVIKAIIDF